MFPRNSKKNDKEMLFLLPFLIPSQAHGEPHILAEGKRGSDGCL
jgi:hypothetical protein